MNYSFPVLAQLLRYANSTLLYTTDIEKQRFKSLIAVYKHLEASTPEERQRFTNHTGYAVPEVYTAALKQYEKLRLSLTAPSINDRMAIKDALYQKQQTARVRAEKAKRFAGSRRKQKG